MLAERRKFLFKTVLAQLIYDSAIGIDMSSDNKQTHNNMWSFYVNFLFAAIDYLQHNNDRKIILLGFIISFPSTKRPF